MHELNRSWVGPEEIDSLGHLNVRFYLARIDRASAVLLDLLGLSARNLDARRAIPIPRSIRAAMEPHYLPEFA